MDVTNVEGDHVFIEAIPKGTSEARLKDAMYTLEALPQDTEGFDVLTVPCFERKPKWEPPRWQDEDDHWEDEDEDVTGEMVA